MIHSKRQRGADADVDIPIIDLDDCFPQSSGRKGIVMPDSTDYLLNELAQGEALVPAARGVRPSEPQSYLVKRLENITQQLQHEKAARTPPEGGLAEERNSADIVVKIRVVTHDGEPVDELPLRLMLHQPVSGALKLAASVFSVNTEGATVVFDTLPVELSKTPDELGVCAQDVLEITLAKPVASSGAQAQQQQQQQQQRAPMKGMPVAFVLQNSSGRVRIEMGTQDSFQVLFDLYCQRQRYRPSDVSVYFDGEALPLSRTPTDLDLDGEEIFDVRVKLGPDGQPVLLAEAPCASGSGESSAADQSGPRITLWVQSKEVKQQFAVLRSKKLKDLAAAFRQRNAGILESQSLRFMFDGLEISPNQTFDDLDIEDNEIIDVIIGK